MSDKFRNFRIGAVCLAGALVLAGCSPPHGLKPPAPAPVAAAPVANPVPPVAEDLLQDMAMLIAGTPRFSVEVDSRFDVQQESGQMIEFGETRTLFVSRPDRFRVEAVNSDGDRHEVLYDGKSLTVYSPGQKVYAQIAKTGGIDAAIEYFLKDLRMRMPLALMLRSNFPEELAARSGPVTYVERTRVDGRMAHHLAGRTDTVDYQFWIADGPKPLPLRVVLTYRTVPGEPAFRARFINWNLAPVVPDGEFAFKAPPGTRRIAFLAELNQHRDRSAIVPENTGTGEPK